MNLDHSARYNLKQYTRLIISFFAALVLLSLYQYTVLYLKENVDTILSTSFLLSIIHHLGFASFAGLICVPIFNYFENWRPKFGFKVVAGILMILLVTEIILLGYYCIMLLPLGAGTPVDFLEFKSRVAQSRGTLLSLFIALPMIGLGFRAIYRLTKKYYHHLAKMYPFTIILFSIFVATLFLDGKPINQNKTQLLVVNSLRKSDNVETKDVENAGFSNGEMVWINSVFNGRNHDKAYLTAKRLAYNKEYDKSLLLSRYILSKVPDHVDTRILTGRVNAWMGHFDRSIRILKHVISSYPKYADAYAALFDVYYWAGKHQEAMVLIESVRRNRPDQKELHEKIQRAHRQNAEIQNSNTDVLEDNNNKKQEIVSIEQ